MNWEVRPVGDRTKYAKPATSAAGRTPPAETALPVYWKNGKVATTDGPFIETKEQLGGFGIPEARDMNHAHPIVSQHPSLKYGSIW